MLGHSDTKKGALSYEKYNIICLETVHFVWSQKTTATRKRGHYVGLFYLGLFRGCG